MAKRKRSPTRSKKCTANAVRLGLGVCRGNVRGAAASTARVHWRRGAGFPNEERTALLQSLQDVVETENTSLDEDRRRAVCELVVKPTKGSALTFISVIRTGLISGKLSRHVHVPGRVVLLSDTL